MFTEAPSGDTDDSPGPFSQASGKRDLNWLDGSTLRGELDPGGRSIWLSPGKPAREEELRLGLEERVGVL